MDHEMERDALLTEVATLRSEAVLAAAREAVWEAEVRDLIERVEHLSARLADLEVSVDLLDEEDD